MTRILVIAPAWVGDMVMAQSLVARLSELEPGATIDLVAPPWTAPLGGRMPGVARTFVLTVAHDRLDLRARARLAAELRPKRYDLAVVLPGSWKSALVPFLARTRRRRGYRGEMRYGLLNDIRHLDPARLPRTVDRFVALAEAEGAAPTVRPPVLTADPRRAAALAERLGLPRNRPLLVLCPGAEFGPAKQWPARHFAAVAQEASRQGYQVAVVGSRRDSDIGAEIVALAGGGQVTNLCGATDLLAAVDVLSLADGVVTNDSGLMHVAAALGRPLVAVYGSTSPAMTPPLSDEAHIAELTLPCRPCFQRICPLGHLDCLNRLEPAGVAATILAATVRRSP